MKLIIDIPEDQLTEEEIEDCIKTANDFFSDVKIIPEGDGITASRAVEILENEKTCVLRTNTCGAECDLVLPDAEIIEAYNMAIEELTVGHTIPSSYVSIDRVVDILREIREEIICRDVIIAPQAQSILSSLWRKLERLKEGGK